MSDYWTRWRAEFEKALDPRLYTIEHLDSLLGNMQAQIWFGENAAIVTELKQYPSGAWVIEGVIAAGDLEEIVETLIPRAAAWGKEAGCIFARIESRSGWIRKLKDHGWRLQQSALIKEL